MNTFLSAHYENSPSLASYNKERRSAVAAWTHVPECAACLSRKTSPFATIRSFSYHKCNECGFVYANPRPTDGYLSDFYNSSFYNNYRACERERIKSAPYFSISTGSIPMIAEWIDDPKARVLDFGCGPGSFIAYLRDKCGFVNVSGIELNKESAAVAREAYGLAIANKLSDLEGKYFDIVALIEVIEHVSNVDEIMRIVGRLLRPGGKLIVTTDAVNNPVSRYFPSWAPHFTGPSHISLFSEKALGRLLNRFGFDIEKKQLSYSDQVFGDLAASPFYNLDFVSPTSVNDLDDSIYVPTNLGRQLGLRPTRRLPKVFGAIRKLDGMVGRTIRRLYPSQFNSHQFVLAQKRMT